MTKPVTYPPVDPTCHCCGKSIYDRPSPETPHPDWAGDWRCPECIEVTCAPCTLADGICRQCWEEQS